MLAQLGYKFDVKDLEAHEVEAFALIKTEFSKLEAKQAKSR